MRLESALFASREGLSAHGTAISVTSDNISNANTIAFKKSRTEFADLVAKENLDDESGGLPSTGDGVSVASIRQIHQTGPIESTERPLDVAIDGRGFFIVGDSENQFYTRAGNLSVNEDGILVDGNGYNVLGFSSEGSEELATLDLSNLNVSGAATTTLDIFGNLAGDSANTTAVANPTTFNEISAAATFIANPTVYDSLGIAHDLTVAFYKTAPNTWTVQAYIDGEDVGGTAGQPTQLGANLTLNFGGDGQLTEASAAAATITAAPNYAGGANTGNFAIDVSGFSQFAGSSQLSSLTQDGKSAGNVNDFEIEENGEVYAVLDNGTRALLGTMRLADFTNVNGLERIGSNLYSQGPNTGDRRLETPGANGVGALKGAALERSTVDIASEFVELVLYQRGYQANSQTLNATSALIRETVQLIR